ncbi:phenolic acid decarboxylase [bacterium]|nr:phenolic acid decarboxylase [bacterium]
MKFVGKRILLHYENGLEIIGEYKIAEVSWEALSGPAKGMKGTENIQALEVGSDIFFINWLESSGTSVSQILDFNNSTMVAFITYDSDKGRQQTLGKGTFSELSPPL